MLRYVFAAAMALPLVTPSPVVAAECAVRAEMIKALGDNFKEAPTAVGVVNPEVVVEIYVSAAGTWTILATGTDGKSCVISAGEGWDSDMLAALPDA